MSKVDGKVLNKLARLRVLSYELVAKELNVSLHQAREVVLDLEVERLVVLATPAEYKPGSRPGRRGRCTWPATFRWADDDDEEERQQAMSEHRKLTQAELVAEAIERFGPDPKTWKFVCPSCGDVACAADFAEGSVRLGQYCVGNFVEGRGCDWKAFGLVRGPWEITMPDGHSTWGFPLADA